MSPGPARDGERSARALAQRERILSAAERCFVRRGFHAASIADIASTADMSAGLIYRYFANKNAIVMAIIERQLERGSALLDRARTPADLVDIMMDAFDVWSGRSDEDEPESAPIHAALFLEIAAEATRDPDIARTAQAADAAIREHLRRALQRHAPTQDAARLASRTLVLQCLIEGLAVRVIRQRGLDRAEVRAALERAIPRLMEE